MSRRQATPEGSSQNKKKQKKPAASSGFICALPASLIYRLQPHRLLPISPARCFYIFSSTAPHIFFTPDSRGCVSYPGVSLAFPFPLAPAQYKCSGPPTLVQSETRCLNLQQQREENSTLTFTFDSKLLMARKSGMTYSATVMLLLITLKERMCCSGLKVPPPENLVVTDLGRLGQMEILWSLPASLTGMTECSVQYQLEYFSTYKDSWNGWEAIRTKARTFTAQFDLMKDVRVRVYTLLDGPCTNNTMIKSTNYTELIQKPPNSGVMGTEVLDFICVFHNMEYTECKWRRSPKMPANSQQHLYFWHKDLEQAMECPEYIISGGLRSGCNFTDDSLPVFTDINFCVNGSSTEGLLKPTFVSLQIQNHVKCAATEKLHLRTGPNMSLELHWEHPDGRVPGHCLEWEVEQNEEGEISRKILQADQARLTLVAVHNNARNCFRVRSRVHKYCASKSFWSDWSYPICRPEEKEATPETKWDVTSVYIYIAVAIIAMLVLSLCVWAVLKVRKSKQEKKLYSLLTSPFAKSSILANV